MSQIRPDVPEIHEPILERTDEPTLVLNGVQFVVGVLGIFGVVVSSKLNGAIQDTVQAAVGAATASAYWWGAFKNRRLVRPEKYALGHPLPGDTR